MQNPLFFALKCILLYIWSVYKYRKDEIILFRCLVYIFIFCFGHIFQPVQIFLLSMTFFEQVRHSICSGTDGFGSEAWGYVFIWFFWTFNLFVLNCFFFHFEMTVLSLHEKSLLFSLLFHSSIHLNCAVNCCCLRCLQNSALLGPNQ